MIDAEQQLALARLRCAFEMFEWGESMKLEQLRREHPGAPHAELQRRLSHWLQTRPGAEHGDSAGRPRPVPAAWR